MKCLGENLTKYIENLCVENYKTLIRDIRDDLNTWRHAMFMYWKIQNSKVVCKYRKADSKIHVGKQNNFEK